MRPAFADLARLNCADFADSKFKLAAWGLTEYDRVLLLDIDLVLRRGWSSS